MKITISIPECKTHKKYRGISQPRETKLYPHGCNACWALYDAVAAIENVEYEIERFLEDRGVNEL